MRITRILFIAAIAMFCGRAEACRCRPPLTPLEELNKGSDAVFSGTITAVERDVTGTVELASVAVEECWKGGVAGTIAIETPYSSAACGLEFAVDVRYLIYAEDVGGRLHTSLCTRTTLLASAQDDLDALGTPHCMTPVLPETWSNLKRVYE